jgi:hypothetical protein
MSAPPFSSCVLPLGNKIYRPADLIDKFYTQSDLRFKSAFRLILDNGKPFTNRILPSPFRGKVKQCYKNCFDMLWKPQDAYYCEGYAIADGLDLAIAHAWLIDDEMRVIDPTWDDDSVGATYFGVVFNQEHVFEIGKIAKYYGILDYMYENHLIHHGFPSQALHPKFHPQFMGE